MKNYNPKLGDANRYENAIYSNKDLAEKINKEALGIVRRGNLILEKVEANPQNKNFHDPITGGRHMGYYLSDAHNIILRDLYGISCINSLEKIPGVPEEVINFINKTKDYSVSNRFDNWA